MTQAQHEAAKKAARVSGQNRRQAANERKALKARGDRLTYECGDCGCLFVGRREDAEYHECDDWDPNDMIFWLSL